MQPKSLFLATALTLMCPFARAEGCFEKHLQDALSINQQRRELYSRASNGASERISDTLMALEKRMLAYQNLVDYDAWSAPYEEKGIHLACEAVVPMTGIPAFAPLRDTVSATNQASNARFGDLLELWSAFGAHDDEAFVAVTENVLARLEAEPRIDCLYRHFLESIRRIASLAPRQEMQARELGLASPRWIQRQMILGHLTLLPTVLLIDSQAHDLNVAGLPILCNDIPRIPAQPVTNR